MISQETTTEFKDALKEEYGKDVTYQEASIILSDLVSYFDLLAKIDHSIQSDYKNDTIYEPD